MWIATGVADHSGQEAFFAQAREQLEAFRSADPSAWKEYRTEAATWQCGTDRDAVSGQDEAEWWE